MKTPFKLPKSNLFFLLAGLSLLLFPISILLIGLYVPDEATMGIVYKIFYFHVPSAFMMYVGFGIAFLGSLVFLFTGKKRWDAYAVSGAEVGLLFTTLVLLSGPFWGRKTWGGYWSWEDPQLVSTFVVYLLFWSYIIVRNFAVKGEKRRTISAVIAVLAAPNIIFIRWAVTVTHPKILRSASGSLAHSMVFTLLFSLLALSVLFATLFLFRLYLEKSQNKLGEFREKVFMLEDKQAQTPIQRTLAFALFPLLLLFQSQVETDFVPATGPTENLPGGIFVVVAYGLMWLAVLLYLIFLWRRQGKVHQEFLSLNQAVKHLDKDMP